MIHSRGCKKPKLCSFDASFETVWDVTALTVPHLAKSLYLCRYYSSVEGGWCLCISFTIVAVREGTCIPISDDLRPILLVEVAVQIALGCWFVVTLCVAVSLKSICSERHLVECVAGVLRRVSP